MERMALKPLLDALVRDKEKGRILNYPFSPAGREDRRGTPFSIEWGRVAVWADNAVPRLNSFIVSSTAAAISRLPPATD